VYYICKYVCVCVCVCLCVCICTLVNGFCVEFCVHRYFKVDEKGYEISTHFQNEFFTLCPNNYFIGSVLSHSRIIILNAFQFLYIIITRCIYLIYYNLMLTTRVTAYVLLKIVKYNFNQYAVPIHFDFSHHKSFKN